MRIHRCADAVRVLAPAKVNLFLEVLRRREDGYHDLATLMLTVGLFDSLELRENTSGEIRLECDHPGLSAGPDNLVCRAARLLRERYRISTGVDIRLVKRIPLAAGLAGGSSDAAATLAGLDRLWNLGLGSDTLGQFGAELGSDVTFFFHGPAAWCTGRGEIVEPVRVATPLDLVLVKPEVGLSTASVFKTLTVPAAPKDGQAVREALRAGEMEKLGRLFFNRLEEPAIKLAPEVERVRHRLLALSPLGVLMSGSGSTVFALARDAADAMRLGRALASGREAGTGTCHVVRSCD